MTAEESAVGDHVPDVHGEPRRQLHVDEPRVDGAAVQAARVTRGGFAKEAWRARAGVAPYGYGVVVAGETRRRDRGAGAPCGESATPSL